MTIQNCSSICESRDKGYKRKVDSEVYSRSCKRKKNDRVKSSGIEEDRQTVPRMTVRRNERKDCKAIKDGKT